MLSDTVSKLALELSRRGLDAIVACSPENFAYVAGFTVPSQSLLRHRHAMSIVTASGEVSLLVVDMEEHTVRGKCGDIPVAVWREFHDSAMNRLADELAARGLAQGKIGIEMKYLPGGDCAELGSRMPHASLVACDEVFRRQRQHKTPDEIGLMRTLARISDQALLNAMQAARPGSSELDFAANLTRSVYALGAEAFKLMIVATGERSQLPNVGPTPRQLESGDVCRFEIFAVRNGYQAGVCRTAVVEHAPPQAERLWGHLIDCKYKVMAMIRPGASAIAVYQMFAAELKRIGLPAISFVGHGAGLGLHEEPYLGSSATIGLQEDVELQEGMVLGIEPLCYRTGHGFGMQNKDVVLVTASGCELLSDVTDTDQLFVIA